MELTPTPRMFSSVFHLSLTKFVVCVNKYPQYRPQGLYLAEKATAVTSKPRYVVAYIGITALYVMCVALITNITVMPTDEINTKIACPAICIVLVGLRCAIHHLLYRCGIYSAIHSVSDNLTRLAA